jgi:hypothetical protein
MPFSRTALDCPAPLLRLIEHAPLIEGHDGRPCLRVDTDVDAETLQILNEFEAHARHRPVRLRLHGHKDCVVGEMNTAIGLGGPADPSRSISRIRLSFHALHPDDCTEHGHG